MIGKWQSGSFQALSPALRTHLAAPEPQRPHRSQVLGRSIPLGRLPGGNLAVLGTPGVGQLCVLGSRVSGAGLSKAMVRVKGSGYSNERPSVVFSFHVTQPSLKRHGRQGMKKTVLSERRHQVVIVIWPLFFLLGLSTASQDHLTGNCLF